MSSEQPAVAVRDVWKTFRFYRRPIHRFTHWLTRGRHGAPTAFHALRAVSFDVPRGSSTGIVGVNGAGKSTLLKILTGTMTASRGEVALAGRVASLLELGTGFHPLFSGRQNVVYNARFLGLTEEEIRARVPDIEAFSELGEFLDRPLRTYSSGMQVRLAFSVAASVDPDVLILDEVLAVGDAYFQEKCIRRIRDFRDRGVTILFVSHDPGAVKALCDRALLLHEGAIVDDATPAAVLAHYNGLIARKKAEAHYFRLEADRAPARQRRTGTLAAVIAEVELLDPEDRPVRAVVAHSEATIRIRVFFFEPCTNPTVGVLVRDRLGTDVWGTNTFHQRIATGAWEAGESLEVRFRLRWPLGHGEYFVTAAVHSLGVHLFDPWDWVDAALAFAVLPPDDRPAVGLVHLPPVVEVAPAPPPAPAQLLARAIGAIPNVVHMGAEDGDLLREGWYAAEGTGDGAFRWTERAAAVLVALDGPELRLEAGVNRPPDGGPVELRVVYLGRELGRTGLVPGPGWAEIVLPLPPGTPRGPARLQLVAGDAWRPADTGHGADGRSLGIRVRRIACPPVGAATAGAGRAIPV